jgi:hypothetical protein
MKLRRATNVVKKIGSKLKDAYYLLRHVHLMRNMVSAHNMDLEECNFVNKKDLLLIAVKPTGGFGDYIISSKFIDELMGMTKCIIHVYCEKVEFGVSVYGKRPGITVLPCELYDKYMYKYDLSCTVEHFIHVNSHNSRKIAQICPELSDKLYWHSRSFNSIYPSISQQCFREAMHFKRCSFNNVNRWTELRHGTIFKISDMRTAVYLDQEKYAVLKKLGLHECEYITVNRGADTMGRSQTQTKVWPLEHYNEFVKLFKNKYPNIKVVQVGTEYNKKIEGVDIYALNHDLDELKWILKHSMLHIDCEGGLVHLSTQLSTKCLVMFGPTPAHFYSYTQNINIVSQNCSDCMGTHSDWAFNCFKGLAQPECMYSITPEIVMDNVNSYLLLYRKNKIQSCCISKVESTIQESTEMLEIINSINKNAKNVAFADFGRNFEIKHLSESGYNITTFDNQYGFSEQTDRTTHSEYISWCTKNKIDARLGSGINIPCDDDSFDIVFKLMNETEIPFASEIIEEILRTLRGTGVGVINLCCRNGNVEKVVDNLVKIIPMYITDETDLLEIIEGEDANSYPYVQIVFAKGV